MSRLIAHVIEHGTGIAEIRLQIPVQARIFQAFVAAAPKNSIGHLHLFQSVVLIHDIHVLPSISIYIYHQIGLIA